MARFAVIGGLMGQYTVMLQDAQIAVALAKGKTEQQLAVLIQGAVDALMRSLTEPRSPIAPGALTFSHASNKVPDYRDNIIGAWVGSDNRVYFVWADLARVAGITNPALELRTLKRYHYRPILVEYHEAKQALARRTVRLEERDTALRELDCEYEEIRDTLRIMWPWPNDCT